VAGGLGGTIGPGVAGGIAGGAPVTVNVAAALVTLPKAFETTTRKRAPLSTALAEIVYEAPVAPAMFTPSLCHR
jgi:hypothetical protein